MSIVHLRRSRGLLAAVVVAPLVVVGLPAATASAAPPDHFSNAPETIEGAVLCDTIVATLTTSGHGTGFVPRPVKGSDGQAFYGHVRYTFTDVWTTEKGSFTVVGQGNSRELSAIKVPGSPFDYVDEYGVTRTAPGTDVYRFTSRDSGSYRFYGSDGQLLLKGTGVYETRYDFDTLSDNRPGGVEVPGTFELVRNKTGNSFADGEDCAAAAAELL